LPQTEFMPINVGHIPLVKWSPRLQTLPTFSQSVGQSCSSSGFMAKSVKPKISISKYTYRFKNDAKKCICYIGKITNT